MRIKKGRALRAVTSALLCAVGLRLAAASTESVVLGGAESLPVLLLRWERGAVFPDDALSPLPALVLRQSPLLHARRAEVMAHWDEGSDMPPQEAPGEEKPLPEGSETAPRAETETETEPVRTEGLLDAPDNGVPSNTLRPSPGGTYLRIGNVYVNNASASPLTQEQLSLDYPEKLKSEGPQVLIVHTHGTEAYTMPSGGEYEPSDDHRTLDESKNMLRVGDEIERVLTEAGLGVVHERGIYDYPSYSGAYTRSLAAVEKLRAEHPSIRYVLDIHRDAVADGEGRQYKLLCAEEPRAAQLEIIVGSDGGGAEHGLWRENLKLACAVQEHLLRTYPTLLRPVAVRNNRYNQHVTQGALLVEVGAAGNSLDEALNAARLFARGFAETLLESICS